MSNPVAASAPAEIVLTGGPCSGKSTAMRYLADHLAGRGWRALVVPEAATMLITGGMRDVGELAVKDRPAYLALQTNLVAIQHSLRSHYRTLATDLATLRDERVVLLFDRAEADNGAYMDRRELDSILRNVVGASLADVASSYDAVLHMVTAADGAEGHYTTANNEARMETPEQAIALDEAVRTCWLGHPHYTVIGNPTVGGFDAKLARTLAAVLNVLGEPEPVEIERKWLLASPPPVELLRGATPVDIEQVYLLPARSPVDGAPVERRVRARTHDGYVSYFKATKRPNPAGPGRIEEEARISESTYQHLLEFADRDASVVRKRRYCFVANQTHFELDHITFPIEAWLLEAELVTEADDIVIPSSLHIASEVTDVAEWKNAAIARRNAPRSGSRA